jgi:hypothetical protein
MAMTTDMGGFRSGFDRLFNVSVCFVLYLIKNGFLDMDPLWCHLLAFICLCYVLVVSIAKAELYFC